jgi:LuxR family maltose regulon positive regulatory protein
MRTRLIERLERTTRFPVTLIVAPAGFGKSVALGDFLAVSRRECIRYDVHRDDATLLAFVRGLSTALAPVAPGPLAAFPEMRERVLAAQEPVRQLSDWFAEHLKRTICTIAIDDLHYASEAAVALVADVIERTSGRVQWIIAARSDLGLPVATWIAYGRMDLPISQDDLRFTPEEALVLADSMQSPTGADEVENLRALTGGWAVALTIALRTRTHAADVPGASTGARELLYRYLAEQVYAALTPEQRAFARASCVFTTFDIAIAHALAMPPDALERFRGAVAFLTEYNPGEYRYDDLFREFLEAELRRVGETEWRSAVRRAAELLEQRGIDAPALRFYARSGSQDDVIRILETNGFSLFERGEAEAISTALDALPEEARRENGVLLGLRAMIDASLGRFEIAEHSFLAAIRGTAQNPELRMRLVQRYALELVRSDRDCVPFLEPYAQDGSIAPQYRVPLLGTIATGYVHRGEHAEARAAIQDALALLDSSLPDETRARLYQQAAYVHRYSGSIEQARAYAQTAVDLALANNMYELAARGYSVLYTIAHDHGDDPILSLQILDKVSECARKGASAQARLFALIAAYEIEVDRGDEAALERLDAEIRENDVALARVRNTALLPARAMRSAWSGRFAEAYAQLAPSALQQAADDQRALRGAEIALYAAAAGLISETGEALHGASAALDGIESGSRRAVRARLFLALTELTRNHETGAHRHLSEAERVLSPEMKRLHAFAHAVRTLYRHMLLQTGAEPLSAALERLRSVHLGGLARLISALPTTQFGEGGYASLTAAEREILQFLASGASTKEIADRTARSPYTVDTHIRSICRKLRCNGRREAVALATSNGWVQR